MKNEKNPQIESKNSYGNNYNNSSYTAYGTHGTNGAEGTNPTVNTTKTNGTGKAEYKEKANKTEGENQKGAPTETLPAGTPTSAGNVDRVSDPPVPNRAHTAI